MTNWRVNNGIFGRLDLKPLRPFFVLLPIIVPLLGWLLGYRLATRREYGESEPSAILTLAFLFSLVSLWGLWVGTGRTRWPTRVTVVIVAFTAISVILRVCFGDGDELILGFVALVQIGAMLAGLGLLRLFRFRMAFRPAGNPTPMLTRLPNRRALTILDLVLWVMASAVLFTEARSVDFDDPNFFWEGSLLLASVALCFSLVAICALWASLGTAPFGWRIAVLSAFAPTSGVLLGSIVETAESPIWWAAVTGLQGACLAGSLGIFRVYGYRLCRQRPDDSDSGTTEPDTSRKVS